jgi:hypothetical protein
VPARFVFPGGFLILNHPLHKVKERGEGCALFFAGAVIQDNWPVDVYRDI